MMRITIPLLPPSPNELRRRYRNPHVYKLRELGQPARTTGAKALFF
jgi:hypothetical protein